MNELIPQNKYDLVSVGKLKEIPYPEYKSILKDLFTWIQDNNWPVAREIVPLLVGAGGDVVPIIKEILGTW